MPILNAPYDSRVVANSFIELARKHRKLIDPMKLQKLVYIMHGWHLAIKGTPLIKDAVEAWPYGPVIPELYYETRRFGAKPVTEYYVETDLDTMELYIPLVNDEDMRLLEIVWDSYGKSTAVHLSALTHEPGTPWALTYDENKRGTPIPTNIIQEHYRQLLQRRTPELSR